MYYGDYFSALSVIYIIHKQQFFSMSDNLSEQMQLLEHYLFNCHMLLAVLAFIR